MVEMPIDALQLTRALVLWGQGVIDGQVDGQGRLGVVCLEVAEDEGHQRQAQVVGIPGADAKEIGEVAGIDTGQFQGRQLGQSLAPRGDDEQVGAALDLLALGDGQGQAEQADEGDNGCRAAYDSFSGGLRSGQQAEVWQPAAVVGRGLLFAQGGSARGAARILNGCSDCSGERRGYSPESRRFGLPSGGIRIVKWWLPPPG